MFGTKVIRRHLRRRIPYNLYGWGLSQQQRRRRRWCAALPRCIQQQGPPPAAPQLESRLGGFAVAPVDGGLLGGDRLGLVAVVARLERRAGHAIRLPPRRIRVLNIGSRASTATTGSPNDLEWNSIHDVGLARMQVAGVEEEVPALSLMVADDDRRIT